MPPRVGNSECHCGEERTVFGGKSSVERLRRFDVHMWLLAHQNHRALYSTVQYCTTRYLWGGVCLKNQTQDVENAESCSGVQSFRLQSATRATGLMKVHEDLPGLFPDVQEQEQPSSCWASIS